MNYWKKYLWVNKQWNLCIKKRKKFTEKDVKILWEEPFRLYQILKQIYWKEYALWCMETYPMKYMQWTLFN